jgi:hypothetical protein
MHKLFFKERKQMFHKKISKQKQKISVPQKNGQTKIGFSEINKVKISL